MDLKSIFNPKHTFNVKYLKLNIQNDAIKN